jgi:alcohol-forming fatty acyl-CoA reductase
MMEFPLYPMYPIKSDEKIVKELFEKDQQLHHLPTIPEFYANREIFITGGSGFMGKVLIEKLLRSCPDVKSIYVLLRPKKGKSIEERLKAITELPLFEPIRKMIPHVLEKIIPVNGDVMEIGLGLSKSDLDLMKNVSVIFHSAASVRFDDSLKYAIIMNTRGTREVMEFAETLVNIKAIVHVSTTYSNPERMVIEEKIYPPYVDWRKAIEIVEKYDDDLINQLTQHYTGFMPNTYVFSKHLAEQVSNDYKHKLPIVVFRPSIVISVMKDPYPGWVDNFNGPVGLLFGSGLGVVRTMFSNPDNRCDFIPVDVCIKAMMIAAWKKAHEPK